MDNSFKFDILWPNKTHNNQIYDSVFSLLSQKFVPRGLIKKNIKKPYRFKVISIISNRLFLTVCSPTDHVQMDSVPPLLFFRSGYLPESCLEDKSALKAAIRTAIPAIPTISIYLSAKELNSFWDQQSEEHMKKAIRDLG